jgi:3-hydroxyisobutyrate dehydrogenase-like beta-hydroxyacid dehydrogenase
VSDVGFLGTGAMGSRMARRLIDAGHSVHVWNRTRERAAPLEEAGATVAATPAEAARGAEVVITMLADERALRAVVEGEDGLVSGLQSGATHLEMSTVGPRAIAWLASALPTEVEVADAPVLGSLSEVEEGTLRIFVGGDARVLERWRGLLSVLGDPVHVGPLGAGAAAKLVANSTLFGSIGIVGEAVALGDGLGLPRDVTYEVLSSTPIAAQVERRRDAIESGEYPLRFALSLAHKDVGLVVDAGGEAGVDLRLARAALEWLEDAERRGWADYDYSALIAHILEH